MSDVISTSSGTVGTRLDWLLFVALGFLWGSSYLFIKIAVEAGLQPFTLIMLRLAIGLTLIVGVAVATRQALPRNVTDYGHLAVMGLISVALPFWLITWAEGTVESSLAATLNAPVPLFVVLLAPLFLADEKLTPTRIAGVVFGLVGVAIVVGFDPASLGRNELVAELALIGSAISYAVGAVYARRFVRGLPPMIPAVFQVFFALLYVTVLAFLLEQPLASPITPATISAVVWLGLLGSGLAYIAFFRLLRNWGAGRTSLVAYQLPVWGIALGFIVLGEPIGAGLILGTALIIVGIGLVNRDATMAMLRSAGARLRPA